MRTVLTCAGFRASRRRGWKLGRRPRSPSTGAVPSRSSTRRATRCDHAPRESTREAGAWQLHPRHRLVGRRASLTSPPQPPSPARTRERGAGNAAAMSLLEEFTQPVLPSHRTHERIFSVPEAIQQGYSIDRIHELSRIDKWFLYKIKNVVEIESRAPRERGAILFPGTSSGSQALRFRRSAESLDPWA